MRTYAWLVAHRDLAQVVAELMPGEAAGDVFDMVTRLQERGVAEDAVRAAHALGGPNAVRALSYAERRDA